MNLQWGSVPRTNKTYWKIDTSLSEIREGAEECKKNMIYRSINFWLKIPISCYKQYFVFLISAKSGGFYGSQFMYFFGHILLVFYLIFLISANWQFCPYIAAYESMLIGYLPHCQQVHGSLLKDTFHWKAALRNSESSVRETRKYMDLKYWRDFINIMIKVKSAKKQSPQWLLFSYDVPKRRRSSFECIT